MSKLLIIGFVWPEPKSSAAGGRMMQLIYTFLAEGYNITFVSSCTKSENAYDLNELGVTTKEIELNKSSFDDFVSELNPDIVLFDRFMMEEQFGWRVIKNCPDALRILDTEDLHSLRKAREQAFKDNQPFDYSYLFGDIAKREIASVYRCDLSLIISEIEMSILQNKFGVPDSLLHYMPFLIDEVSEDKKAKSPSFEKRHHFITIGNFLHPPNLDSVKFLKEAIWPKIRSQLNDAELHIYGAYANEKVRRYEDKKNGFFIKGYTEDADDVMMKAKICLSPLRFGAGLKGKFFDAMQNGTPFITTSIGAEGIFESDTDFVLDNLEDLVSCAVKLYQDKILWESQKQIGYHILSDRFNKKLYLQKFLNRIEDLNTNKENYRLNNFIGSMLNFHTMQSTKYMSRWIEEKNK
jgi:hypothetical protein